MNSELKANLRSPALSEEELSIYGWQMDLDGFGLDSQLKLKNSTVLISRIGGLGGSVAWQLAAAGVGRLILAHAGVIKPSDLNRQTLMTRAGIQGSRVQSAYDRLKAFNPDLDVVAIPENASVANADRLAKGVDLIVDCAPLFQERYALNSVSVRKNIPMVEVAVYGLEFYLTSMTPGQTPCLRCLYPEQNEHWKRRFPVLGAVAGAAGSMAAAEAVKLLTGLGTSLEGVLFTMDLRSVISRRYKIRRNRSCDECGSIS